MKSLKPTKFSKGFLPVIFVLFSVASLNAQPELVDGIVAVIGDNIVLKSDVDKKYKQSQGQNQSQGGSRTKCQVFEELMMEKMLLHQADLDSIKVTDEQVQTTLDRRINVFVQKIGSRQRLEQYYDKSIVEIKNEMEPLVRDQMIAQKMLQEIHKDLEITPSEVRTFYNSLHKDSLPLIDAQMEYAEIKKYPKVGKEAKQAAIDKLKEIKQKVKDGSSFSTMAVLYSEDPGSAKDGGKYEGVKRGQFVKEFEAVAYNMKPGEISEPFRTEHGYHIVQLLKKRGEELDLRHILIKPKIAPENLKDAQHFLDSIRGKIKDGTYTFAEAAKKFSDDKSSRQNGGVQINPQSGDTEWATGMLGKDVFYTLKNLKEGKISDAVFFREEQGQEGYRLLKLISKTEPHRADLTTDYQRIQQAAKAKKKQEALNDWIEEKLKDTYVRVNNDYLNCEFERSWIKKTNYVE